MRAAPIPTNDLYDRLLRAASLDSEDAAIRISSQYEPSAGRNAKVSPPTYPPSGRAAGDNIYLTELRHLGGDEPVRVVLLDAFQSQANRCEEALLALVRSGEIALPHLRLDYSVDDGDRVISGWLTSLEAPHRSRDAYFRDALVGTVSFDDTAIGADLARSDVADARAFLEHAPLDLVLGTWDSHRGRRRPVRFARVYASEVVGVAPEPGRRGGARMDPNVLAGGDSLDLADWGLSSAKAKKSSKLSEIGHGMIPPQANAAPNGTGDMPAGGGVSVASIRRVATLSFSGLAALRFGDADMAYVRSARAVLACLALLGDRSAFGAPAITLRSGSDLVQTTDELAFVVRGGATEPFELSAGQARELFIVAVERAESAGVVWDGSPVVMTPKPALQAALAKALTTVDLTASVE